MTKPREGAKPRPAPLPPLSPEQRRQYETLRRYGVTREQALAELLKDKAA